MKFHALALAAAAGLLMSAVTAEAATEHFTFSIPTSSFALIPGDPALAPGTVSLSFDLNFDPTQTYTDTTVGISNVQYSGVVDDPVGFNNNVGGNGTLVVGGVNFSNPVFDGVSTIPSTPFHTNDFYIHITNIATNPTFQQFGFSTATGNDFGNGNYYYTPADPVGVTFGFGPVSTPTVPLPGALPLFGAALAAMAGLSVVNAKRKSGHAASAA